LGRSLFLPNPFQFILGYHRTRSQSSSQRAVISEWLSKWVKSHSPVEGEWPVVIRPLLSSKMRSLFKTRQSFGRTKIRSWVQKGPETKHDYVGKGHQQFNGVDRTVQWASS
jgi:hypothetical protein